MSPATRPVRGILDLIHHQVAVSGEGTAVEVPNTGRSLTYAQLWEEAGWLAAQLAAAGVRRGDLVAVDLPRGAELIVALVGVVRAGAAYLPLDEQAPAQRVAAMLADAAVAVMVTGRAGPRVAVAGLACVSPPAEAPDAPVPQAPVGGDDTLYVTYTSGSTGRAKGVVVPHRGIVRLVDQPEFCPLRPGDRVASTCNPAFDVIASEIWGGLAAGATVVPFPSFVEVGIGGWLRLIPDAAVDVMFLATSVFHTIARERPNGFAGLRQLVLVGEQLDLAVTRRVLRAGPPGRLVNGYGPTEASVFASFFECTERSLAGRERIPIGRPLAATDLYVLGDDLRPVRSGQVGELCVGGPGVANGYLRRPEITAERFVHAEAAAGVVYRTGDLARLLPDGELEFLGRRDRQVKIRGFRLELDEIEQATVATGLVDAAFVEVDGEGVAATLVGLVLPPAGGDGDVDTRALAGRLAAVLPGYAVPTRWVVLPGLPLGPTGKADRRAMARLLHASAPVGRAGPAGVAERAAERAVLAAVREYLPTATVTPESNFVDLGGNSMQAVMAAHRMGERLNAEVAPVELLGAGTLRDLIREIAHRIGANHS